MKIFARRELAEAAGAASARNSPSLVLEGALPAASKIAPAWSLDETIDSRFDWIDAEAARLADEIEQQSRGSAAQLSPTIPPAYLHALALRYYLVRLLRPMVFLQDVMPPPPGSRCELYVTPGLDEDYAALITDLAQAGQFDLQIHWRPGQSRTTQSVIATAAAPANSTFRRVAGRLAGWIQKIQNPRQLGSARAVVLHGNPRVLEPVCRELLRRQVQVAWLYDRFAFGNWLRWGWRGAGQLICNSDRLPGLAAPPATHRLPQIGPVSVRGVQLGPIVERWLQQRSAWTQPPLVRFLAAAMEHLANIRPRAVILDEDATPRARATVAAARRLSIPTWVVQHGAPGIRFGFTPLAADFFCAADSASQRQLLTWGAPADRVIVTGSPAFNEFRRRLQGPSRRAVSRSSGNQPATTFLYLASTPPRDDRPDAVTYHLTRQTYRDQLLGVCRALSSIRGARLIIKPHPRDPQVAAFAEIVAAFPSLSVEIARQSQLEKLLPITDVVLNCASTAGLDAAALGWTVIQLLPAGSGDVLSAAAWGLLGPARSEAELAEILPRALAQCQRERTPRQLADRPDVAAQRIVDAVLPSWTNDKLGAQQQMMTAPKIAGRQSVGTRPSPLQ